MGPNGTRAARYVALLGIASLLTACSASPSASGCSVSYDSPDLLQLRQQAGIADCTSRTLAVDPNAATPDFPDTKLGCLGSKAAPSLADIKGPAIINFWAPTCGPCRKEMPALAAFAKKYAGQVTVVGVDYLDTYPHDGLQLARDSGVTYPLLADACGDLQQSSLHPPAVLPFFYIVSADGSITHEAGGFDSVDQIVQLAQQHGISLTSSGSAG